MPPTVELVIPALSMLDAYIDALERGWPPRNDMRATDIQEQLQAVRADPARFIAQQVDPEAKGAGTRARIAVCRDHL